MPMRSFVRNFLNSMSTLCAVDRAVAYLESLELTEETETMWRTLGHMALEERLLAIAERSFSALGDVAKAQYVRDVIQLQEDASRETVQPKLTPEFLCSATMPAGTLER